MKKHQFCSLLFEALANKGNENAVVFIAFSSSGQQKVLEKQWFSFLFQALGSKSIEKELLFDYKGQKLTIKNKLGDAYVP